MNGDGESEELGLRVIKQVYARVDPGQASLLALREED